MKMTDAVTTIEFELTQADIDLWVENGWEIDVVASKQIPNLDGSHTTDYQHVSLIQWKARATKDNGGAVEEPPF